MATLTNTTLLLTTSNAAQTMVAPGSLQDSQIARLTSGLASGDEVAFREFHEKYFDRLLRYHLVLARGDETAAHDALQETFLRVVRHARKFHAEDVFWSWLTVLARSAAADGGRKQQRYWRLLGNYARSLFAPPPPNEVAGLPLEEYLDQSLSELSCEDRAMLEAKYFRRASVRELAAEIGLSEKAVESRLLRARGALREKILEKLRHENAT